MQIETLVGFENAVNATGFTVIVDVLRAGTVAAYLLDRGCSKVIPVRTSEEAFAIKRAEPSVLLVGEDTDPIPGFDYNNSPSDLVAAELSGRIAVHRTRAGTQGLKLAVNASTVVFGSFVVFDALVARIEQEKPEQVSIVCTTDHPDDLLFAKCLQLSLRGLPFNFEEEAAQLRYAPKVDRFFCKDPSFPERDFWLAMEISKFDFVPVLKDGALEKWSEPK